MKKAAFLSFVFLAISIFYYNSTTIEAVENGIHTSYYKDTEDLIYSETEMRNGLKNGLETIYLRSGTIYALINYKDGRMHGNSKWFHSNENLREDSNYIYGKLNGIQVKYYEDGAPEEQGFFKDDMRTGVSEWYYPEGGLVIQAEFKDNQKNGYYVSYYKDGLIYDIREYENNTPIDIKKMGYPK